MPHGWAPFEESKKDDIFDLTAMGPGGAGGYLEEVMAWKISRTVPSQQNGNFCLVQFGIVRDGEPSNHRILDTDVLSSTCKKRSRGTSIFYTIEK